jgi:hypothetical protein
MEEEKKGQGFVVRDKRHFDKAGNVQSQAPTAEPADRSAGDTLRDAGPALEAGKDERADGAYPAMDFTGFILSLSTAAMYHFGDIPDPYTQKREKNLTAARQTIDILSMIQEKTRGNLDEQEKEILGGALYELRMRFVKEKDAS